MKMKNKNATEKSKHLFVLVYAILLDCIKYLVFSHISKRRNQFVPFTHYITGYYYKCDALKTITFVIIHSKIDPIWQT